ncbi:amidase signature domain-containing protein [Aspergillus carlsbadensis]|nr:amidase signature domain-containing protein [Aspergillus carlsbadensis]
MGWEETAQANRARRDKAIPSEWQLQPGQVPEDQLNVLEVPAECGLLTARELEITETDADILVQKLLSREYSSHEVTLAFCKRSAIAQQLVNCLSEIIFDTALEAAHKLDKEYVATGVARGPLHGLPVSLKDCFPVEGTDATIGYTAFANTPTSEDEEAEITKIMRESGAILFCKTNVPTAMMSGETYNAIYGYTSNPYNRSLSSGGSSGGESALLALRGSPLGVGTDVGGSVRIPASFCGLYSLKPSAGRFPTLGLRDGMEGQETVRNAVGPMAKSLAAIDLWSRVVLKSEPWMSADPHCLPIQYREVEVPKNLCFGLLLDDEVVKPLPPVTRALLQTKAALEVAGHTVIEFHLDDPLYTDNLKYALYRSAAADLVHKTLARTQEPWPRGMEMLEAMINDDDNSQATVSDLWEAQSKRTEYAKRVLKAWAATKTRTGMGREMDALLLPCTPWPACEKYGFTYDNYTSMWNVLDYCATTVPVSQVSLTEDVKPEYECRNEAEEHVWKDYKPESLLGAPVTVQLVGRRLNEEYLLGVTKACDDALRASSC